MNRPYGGFGIQQRGNLFAQRRRGQSLVAAVNSQFELTVGPSSRLRMTLGAFILPS